MYRIEPKSFQTLLAIDRRVTMDLKTAFRLRPAVWGHPADVLFVPWDTIVDAIDDDGSVASARPMGDVIRSLTHVEPADA